MVSVILDQLKGGYTQAVCIGNSIASAKVSQSNHPMAFKRLLSKSSSLAVPFQLYAHSPSRTWGLRSEWALGPTSTS